MGDGRHDPHNLAKSLLFHSIERFGRHDGDLESFELDAFGLEISETKGATQAGDDVDVKAPFRGNVLDGRVLAQQIVGRDLVDVGVVEDALQSSFETLHVLPLGREKDVQILGGAGETMEVQGNASEDHVDDTLPLESGQHLTGAIEVHDRILFTILGARPLGAPVRTVPPVARAPS